MGGKHSTGKGDRYRPVDRKAWDANWEAVFGKRQKKTPKPRKGNANNGKADKRQGNP